MPITYPISFAGLKAPRRITIRPRSVVGVAASPFTLQPQTYAWAGQLWAADVELPPMARADAEAWAAALTSLNGAEGSFLLGDTANKALRGTGAYTDIINATTLNGGFETAGGGGADVFASWTEFAAGTSAIVRDTATKRSGVASCRFDVDGSESDVSVEQTVLEIGRRYRCGFWARNDGAGSLRIDDTIIGSYYSTGALTTSFAYHEVEFVAVSTRFYFTRGTGSAGRSIWLDDVTLTPLDYVPVPLVMGGSQTGTDLITDGWEPSKTVVQAGDWIQLGSGSTARLYKVLADAVSNGSGEATLILWPKLRSSPADNAALTIASAQGRFMLAGPVEWSIDEMKLYGLAFSAVEDLRP